MPFFSEIIRFVLPAQRKTDFARLRQYLAAHGAVKDQYFGATIATPGISLQVKKDEMCWVIQWPHNSELRTNAVWRAQLRDLSGDQDARSLLFRFKDTQGANLAKALEAPICEFATINLTANAPISDADFKHSMHKTYTDCYLTQGFVGGDWAYAANTNDTNGVLLTGTEDQVVDQEDDGGEEDDEKKSLAFYYLGWESVEAHQAYSKTSLFEEEIVKLAPWFGPGTGAWYVKFEKSV